MCVILGIELNYIVNLLNFICIFFFFNCKGSCSVLKLLRLVLNLRSSASASQSVGSFKPVPWGPVVTAIFNVVYLCFSFFPPHAVWGVDCITSHMLGKCSATELHHQGYLKFWDRILLSCPNWTLTWDPSSLVSQIVGVTGMHHHIQQCFLSCLRFVLWQSLIQGVLELLILLFINNCRHNTYSMSWTSQRSFNSFSDPIR